MDVAYQFDIGRGEQTSSSVELSLPPSPTNAHTTHQNYVSFLEGREKKEQEKKDEHESIFQYAKLKSWE